MASSHDISNACDAYFAIFQIEFKKMYKISITGVIWILKYHNPLKRIDAWEIARILNRDNELRRKARISRLRYS